jgi:cation/acetate symporter
MLVNAGPVRAFFAMGAGADLWFGILPISAGVFGVPTGFVVTWLVSLTGQRGR